MIVRSIILLLWHAAHTIYEAVSDMTMRQKYCTAVDFIKRFLSRMFLLYFYALAKTKRDRQEHKTKYWL